MGTWLRSPQCSESPQRTCTTRAGPRNVSFVNTYIHTHIHTYIHTYKLIEQAHLSTLHGGVAMTMAKIRESYWILDSKVTPTSKTNSIELLGMQTVPRPVIRKPISRTFTCEPNARCYTIWSSWSRVRGSDSLQDKRKENQEILFSYVRVQFDKSGTFRKYGSRWKSGSSWRV